MQPTDAELLVEFGGRIRSARMASGLSQERLAEHSGMHRTYIGSLERGERNIGVLNLLAVACALNLDPSALVADLHRSRR